MMRWIRFGAALALLWASMAGAEPRVLIFGTYAADKPTTTLKKIKPRLKALEAALNGAGKEPVVLRYRIAPSYEKGLDELLRGKVDFARLGPASYVEAKSRNPAVRVLALESRKGRTRFKGVIAVRQDSPIRSVAELAGKRFAFGNRRSTIGRYLAQAYLLDHGIRADDLAGFEYLGRHDKVGWAVAMGQFDAGALKESTFNKVVKAGAPLRILATFPNVTKPWVAAPQLDEAVFQRLRAAMLSLGPEAFLPGDDGDFAVIRDAIERSARFFGD
ncbi:phosphonate transport system substrate-binding protein [Methylomarinovum caldicuralii]|uniref:Phosphonate transport system substrate-binding protein n=1 Tax=Methylomarinovum caldicuralii TaxID=438856 RepID=A0AAU9CP54_9GAMM|nr:PhnD/SsuA/transferrin family substrate-binding protein [Methylomarinovum caldicuralii]BCX81312.1 phosphonate transport system substrate-binding protein [Methylomarinovum caldicuralii]